VLPFLLCEAVKGAPYPLSQGLDVLLGSLLDLVVTAEVQAGRCGLRKILESTIRILAWCMFFCLARRDALWTNLSDSWL